MSTATAAVPMPPPGGSLIGRSIKGVLWSGVYGAVGSTIGGWIKGGSVGKVLGASIGAGAGILGFGMAQGLKDRVKWHKYQWERYNYALQTGDFLPNLERGRAFWKRRAKNLAGIALVGSALVWAGPAVPVMAFAYWGGAAALTYGLTKLATRPFFRRPDFRGLAEKKAAEQMESEAPIEEPPDLPGRATNVPIRDSINNQMPLQPGGLPHGVRLPGARIPRR